MAMISEATVMSKPSSRGARRGPPAAHAADDIAQLTVVHVNRALPRNLAHVRTRSSLPWWIWLSIIAASRLFAAPMAWKSPVK